MPLPGQKSLLPSIMHAQFSDDMKYRYTLTRDWSRGRKRKTVNFIITNPETADETNDDMTVKRCLDFAESWGYNKIVVTSLFAWRNTDTRWLKTVFDPVGPENNSYLLWACILVCDLVVCAWGNHGGYLDRDQEVVKLLKNNVSLYCLKLTNSGRPRHPLGCDKKTTPQSWIPGVAS